MKTEDKNIEMYYGDYGITLPIIIRNTLDTDEIKFNIYNVLNELKLEKILPYEEERWILELTKEESLNLKKGDYWYEVVQYRNGILQKTINKGSLFRVK